MQKTIFVDCFNTILERTASADDILFSWGEAMGERYGYHAEFFFYGFKSAERKLGTRAFFTRGGEVEYTFREICGRIRAQMRGTEEDGETFYASALSLYMRAEMENHRRNDALYERLAARKREGCSLYLVSEFYCGKEVLRTFLRNIGADIFDDIFVSCDCFKSKRTGALYRYALKKTGAKRRSTCMIGDNAHVDRDMARLNLLKAERLRAHPPERSDRLKAELKKSTWEKAYDEIFDGYGKEYNYSNYAFTLYLFTKRLYERFTASGGTALLFCSREGQFLKKLFDAYCEIRGVRIKTCYLYASRNSVSALRPIDEEDFAYIKRIYPLADTVSFLRSLTFTEEHIGRILARLGIGERKRTRRYFRSETYKRLYSDELFRTLYEENRTEKATAFLRYLDTFGVDFEKDGFYMVDVGWHGGVQTFIEQFFGDRIAVHGYYIGLSDKSTTKEGLLRSKKGKKYVGDYLFRHRILDYEQILRADHDRVAGYALENGEAKIVFGNEVDQHRIYEETIRPMQDQIFAKFVRIAETDRPNSGFEYTACNYFYRMMTHISRQDVAWLERCEDTHYDFFGKIGLVFEVWGHKLVRIYHGAQTLLLRLHYRLKPTPPEKNRSERSAVSSRFYGQGRRRQASAASFFCRPDRGCMGSLAAPKQQPRMTQAITPFSHTEAL